MLRHQAWLLVLATPAAAWAQPAPAPEKAAEKPRDVETVVVTAAPTQDVRVSIDRRSYSVAKDIQAATGTLADMLRGVPSVDVDPQGNVTLRGDPGVVITIDGKPSGMFTGEARGQAVQSLPADQFERVEVVTNPSAAESAEGAAGIINLVSKTTRKAGASGLARISVGTFGQYATGATLGYNTARLALTGDVSYRGGDPQTFISVDARSQVSPTGERTGHLVETEYRGLGHIFSGRIGADYDLDDRTRIGAQVRYMTIRVSQPGFERFEDQDAAGRTSISIRDIGRSPLRNDDTEGSLSFRRKLGHDRELTADLRQERMTMRFRRPDRVSSLTSAVPDVFGEFNTRPVMNTTGAKLNYRQPLANGGELKLGYDLRIDDSGYKTVIAFGPAPDALVADPGLGGALGYHAAINAGFVTWQRRIGDLTALAGLRMEDARVTIRPSAAPADTTDRLRPYPSLHLSYPLDDDRKLSGSYSRRVERPSLGALDPTVQYQNGRTLYRGNPRLKPQETDSFELGYEGRKGDNSLTATLFYRHLHDAMTSVAQEISPGVLLFTRANLGDASRTGLSLSASRKLTSRLTYSLSGDLYRTQIQAANLGFAGRRSVLSGIGRASLSWQASAADLLQADVRMGGKALTPQGYRTPYAILNLGYRRRLTPTLFAVATVQNVMDSAGLADTLDTPTLHYRRSFRGLPATVTFGLTYSFGGAKKPAAPAFDFGGPPS